MAALESNVFWVCSRRLNVVVASLVNVRCAVVAVAGITWPVIGSVAPTGTTKEPGVLLASRSWRFTGWGSSLKRNESRFIQSPTIEREVFPSFVPVRNEPRIVGALMPPVKSP